MFRIASVIISLLVSLSASAELAPGYLTESFPSRNLALAHILSLEDERASSAILTPYGSSWLVVRRGLEGEREDCRHGLVTTTLYRGSEWMLYAYQEGRGVRTFLTGDEEAPAVIVAPRGAFCVGMP